MRIQTTKRKDQLDEFMQNVYANQQTFHNSCVEINEVLKRSLTDTVQSRMDQSELAAQFAAFTEAKGDGQCETKTEFNRLELATDRQHDRISELLGTLTRNTQGAAEATTESLKRNASNTPATRQI